MLTKEKAFARAAVDEVFVRNSKDFHNTCQLLLLVLAREDRETCIQLSQDTTQTPHVDGHMIVHAEDNFRGAVEPTLDIRVDLFVFEATTAKINNLDCALSRVAQ